MKWFEFAAVIGALAWLPQIFTWIYQWLVKSQVRIVLGTPPEVGYTTLGPILNLDCAISASRCDAIIEKITINLRHDKGQSTILHWKTLDETFSKIRSGTGETAEVTKSQQAIALKVSTLILVEKRIGFQDLVFQEKQLVLLNSLNEEFAYLKKNNPENYRDLTLKSKEMSNLSDFYQKNVFWQEGRYLGTICIHVLGTKEPKIQTFNFSLSKNDIDRLILNIEKNNRVEIEMILPPETHEKIPYIWSWIYPKLQSK